MRKTMNVKQQTRNGADATYRRLLAEADLFHILYGHGTKAEKAKASRLWKKALLLDRQATKRTANPRARKTTIKNSVKRKIVTNRNTTNASRQAGYLVSGMEKVGLIKVPIGERFSTLAAAQRRQKEFAERGIKTTVKNLRTGLASGKRNSTRQSTVTRRNAALSSQDFTATKRAELSAIFQGEINGQVFKSIGSSFVPDQIWRLGKLTYMRIKNPRGETYDLEFKGKDAWLTADARKNLSVIGRDTKIQNAETPPTGALYLIGQLEQVNYVTAKKHIENGETVEYYHKLGEIDGIKPSVFLDSDKFLVINSGNYDIGVWGVEN